LLESIEKDRPSAEEALEHPVFSSKGKKVDFLEAVGNQKEFECPRSKRGITLTQPRPRPLFLLFFGCSALFHMKRLGLGDLGAGRRMRKRKNRRPSNR
jgi:hypothetical protein